MKRNGPDSLEGLFAALTCCLIFTLMCGPVALSSMLFVACISRYNTDRNKASFPFILSNVLQAVSGPFTGYLAKKFSIRAVVLTGSVLAPLGIGVCYLAEDITTVTISFGIIYGIGYGLSILLLPVIINDYFIKQRSIAMGMCYLGSPIGFFIFPPIFEVLLDKYGLSGSFLLLSGLIMHCIPLSMLIRKPSFKGNNETSTQANEKTISDSHLSSDCRISSAEIQSASENRASSVKNKLKTYCRRFSIEILWEKSNSTEYLTGGGKQYVFSLNKKDTFDPCVNPDLLRSFQKYNKTHYENLDALPVVKGKREKSEKSNNPDIINSFNNSYQTFSKSTDASVDIPKIKVNKNISCKKTNTANAESYEECSTIYYGTFEKSNNFVDSDVKRQTIYDESVYESVENGQMKHEEASHFPDKICSVPVLLNYKQKEDFSYLSKDSGYEEDSMGVHQNKRNNVPEMNNLLIKMYFNPVFILMCFINAVASLHFSTLTTVIIDFSRDHEINSEYEKYILMCISITGAFGMLGFSWVTDGGYLSRVRFGSLSQLIGSISTAILPFTVGLETLMIALSVWCICQASFIPIIPAIIAEYFDEDTRAVAVSACFVLCGPLYLIIPPLIGYFRDEKGSYDNIFFLLGCLSFVNCIAVFIIPYLARWKAKR